MQAERDSLAGLSEVLTSQTPSLVPHVGGWYSEPNEASQQAPQQPGLMHLRHRLGLPLQQPAHQTSIASQTQHGQTPRADDNSAVRACQIGAEPFINCSYEVSRCVCMSAQTAFGIIEAQS